MVTTESAPVIAVINMHVEIVDMLQMALQGEGFAYCVRGVMERGF